MHASRFTNFKLIVRDARVFPAVYKLLFVSHSMHMRIRKYCVTFSEKQEDYDVIFGQFPQEQLSLVINHVIFLTNNKLWTVHV